MEIRHLHYFMAVCEELHFTKAAEKLGISQPTLSQQVRVLEEELDMPLFDRIGKKIVMTEAGTLLFSYATEMLNTLQNVKDAIKDLQELQGGQISVGIMPSDLDYRITQLVIDFHQKFPKVKLKILASIDIMRQVLENEVDIGIGTNVEPDERLVIIPLRSEEYVLTVSKGHPLADQTAISIAELKDLPMVMYPEGFLGREIVEEAVKKHGFQLHSILETSSVTSIINLVRANIGVTVQPYPLVQQMNDPNLCIIRISDGAPSRSLSIIYRVDRYVSQATTAFIEQIKEYFKS
ncbi:LysR family transcriptional regulator [Lysinibacillus cavernae]|uniref:LysR family transcriptional regulator n=1 Tax=Lysinibacillus cavernae TaxID=2666135 RepID=UPI0012D92ADF|nr:LysR family transcriptional regulator [Lysinibacillus cavernae]